MMTHERWIETSNHELPDRVVGSFASPPPNDGRVYLDLKSRTVWRNNIHLICGRKRFRLIFGLMCGCEMTRLQFENLIWGDEKNGGPLDMDGTFRLHLMHTKKVLESIGLTIKNRWGYGYRLARATS